MNREQLLACLWLRWRLTKNQFARGGKLNAVMSFILVGLMLAGAAGCAAGGLMLGFFGLAKASPEALLWAWDGVMFVFLMFWVSGLMIELQRSETIELRKLLHLPVTLRQVFAFNYIASHFTPSILLFVPLSMGICVGLILRLGPSFIGLLPLPLAILFAVTAWTYCLRGWLAALMVNKRRRRAIMLWITVGFILLSQLPNLLLNSHGFIRPARRTGQTQPKAATGARDAGRSKAELQRRLVQMHVAIPPGWVGYGAMRLRQGNPWPGVAGAATAVVIGLLGLMRAYRMTMRFYTGAEGGKKPSSRAPVRATRGQVLLVDRTLPWVPEEIAALALATLRSLLRAPEMKMAMIMPIVFSVLSFSFGLGKLRHAPASVAYFAPAIAVGIAVFSFANVMGNMFGLDRSGFRALVLFPTRRDWILMGKNLALFPFVGGSALVLLVLAGILLHLPWDAWVAGTMQIAIAFLMFSLLCNLLSIFAPYRISPGTLQAKKPKGIVFLAMLVSMVCLPVVLLPAFIPSIVQTSLSVVGWAPWLPANVLAAVPILVAVWWFYRFFIKIEGRLLQRREQDILKEVIEEVE